MSTVHDTGAPVPSGRLRWVEAAPLVAVRPGRPLGVWVDGRAVALYRVGDAIYATDDLCSHMEASLSEGQQDGDIVTCPRHGGQFDIRTGAAVRLPPVAPIETFSVEIRGDRVWVALAGHD